MNSANVTCWLVGAMVTQAAFSGSAQAAPLLNAAFMATMRDVVCELTIVDRNTTKSHFCLACHDGSVAASTGTGGPDGAVRGTHRVGMLYEAVASNEHLHLRPRATLPRELVLVEGRVECVTCHSGTSAESEHVAVSMTRSALCISCHGM